MTGPWTLFDSPGDRSLSDWFAAMAERLLNGAHLVAGGQRCRLVEVEAYYKTIGEGSAHADPFAHAHAMQEQTRVWYFHRAGAAHDSYTGGTYKGLDIAFGPRDGFGGMLLRSLEPADGTLITGSSRLVDFLLEQTGFETVADLDGTIGDRWIHDPTSPLHLVANDDLAPLEVFATARVGLTLKRADKEKAMPAYVGRHYRYLARPADIEKGRVQLVLALHQQGREVEAIAGITGMRPDKVAEYIRLHDEAAAEYDANGFAEWTGRTLKTADLCGLLGACHRSAAG